MMPNTGFRWYQVGASKTDAELRIIEFLMRI